MPATLRTLFLLVALGTTQPGNAIDFSRDVRPLLASKCFKCHGPDEGAREADLRLDTAKDATADRGGYQAIRPGDPDASILVERIRSSDETVRMPPPDSGLSLSTAEQDLLEQWTREGAVYEEHWAFRPVVRPSLPAATTSTQRNPIDLFVLARLTARGLEASLEADRSTLIRRVHLDLLGLPPDPVDVATFLADELPGAYERMLDRALASPSYGERWGRHWLDQARYADTNGYTVDSERSIWPYRDWVIAALNADMPFDQFTIEQLAGDLLPNSTREQLIATGFHRNTLVNQEGGTDAEQFRNEAVVDRVNTTGAVWLGLTVGCAQCHTHKYDPLTQREYYQLFAFFNSSQDVNSVTPQLRLETEPERAQLAELDERIQAVKEVLAQVNNSAAEEDRKRLTADLKRLEAAKKKLADGIPTTMVMRELDQPRPTHVLIRGDFLRKSDPVAAAGPSFLPSLPPGASTRLELARWIVQRENPLTARVTVNRVWGRLFGQGLVETENDFGIQGTPPTHADLLDWLSMEFMEQGWSLKHLHRLILNSATYRQSSHARPDLQRADPLNQLLGRQVRLRVDAEIVRDLGLSVSGLLTQVMGGPSVYPPQPEGVYAFTQRQASWPTSAGKDRYRRALYTFFMRSAPYPMLTTFDTPRFDTTCTRRVRSNTPLQSLTLANDQTMIELARALGQRLWNAASDDVARITFAYQLCFTRRPSDAEVERLREFVSRQRQDFQQAPEEARLLVSDDDSPSAEAVSELATWTVLARALLNLDEFITRE